MQPPQPPESSDQPHYLTTSSSAPARDALERRGRRDVVFGSLWILFGLVVTLITVTSGSPVVYVVWGPVLYGAYLIFRGVRSRDRG
jgi:hypothetical protein